MVEFKMKFDERIGKKLAEIQHQNTVNKISKIKLVFIFIGIFLIAYSVLDLFNEVFDYFIFAIGVFSLLFWILFPKILKKNLYRQQEKITKEGLRAEDIAEEVYKFDAEKVFIFSTMGEKYRSAIETTYDYFVKIFEDDDCYILYLSSVQCYIIFKDSLTMGSIQEFNNYLKINCDKERYVRNIN